MSGQAFSLFGTDLFGNEIAPSAQGPLAKRFTLPPFSVLDARSGAWHERKDAWLRLGIKSEVGRSCHGSNAWNDLTIHPRAAESSAKIAAAGAGPTIFDPVLCELVYRWFSPERGMVLDPFAGGSVRGLVAVMLGREYVGLDLRSEQVEANREQASAICHEHRPCWIEADSRLIGAATQCAEADLVFSCPPYGDLERYSDDPRDISTLDFPEFLKSYRDIVSASCALLKRDRFACFVVGDFRDRKGEYRNFPGETIRAFMDAGLLLYNEAILVTAVGSTSLRAGRQFDISRKLGKTHQNVLVFAKGDPRKAAEACARVHEESLS